MFILGMILGIVIGMFIIVLISENSLNEEIKEHYNAELRAITHFRKLQSIERIINTSEATKEPAVFIVDKIKEVIVGQNK